LYFLVSDRERQISNERAAVGLSPAALASVSPLSYQARAYSIGGLPQPALWVEQAEVPDEHWLLMLLSVKALRPCGDPLSPCNARILFILSPFAVLKVVF
jgi:hypothetical protein